jgi:hypothetical protein
MNCYYITITTTLTTNLITINKAFAKTITITTITITFTINTIKFTIIKLFTVPTLNYYTITINFTITMTIYY